MEDSQRKHWVSVAAAVVDSSNRVLALRRRDNGKWEPPGGTLEPNEAIYEGLLREVREETGLAIEPLALTGVYKNMADGIVALVFRCRTTDQPLTESPEAAEIRWLTADEITTLMDEAYACRLTDALARGGPAVRVHDGTALLSDVR